MSTEMMPTFTEQARQVVTDHFNGSRDPSDKDRYLLKMEDVYVVWFCKTLQNWKALVSTILPDLTYYEVTFNGNENVIYLDVYVKNRNIEIPLAAPVTRMTEGYKKGDDPILDAVMKQDAGGATDLPKKSRGGGSLPNLMGAGKPDQPSPYRTPYD